MISSDRLAGTEAHCVSSHLKVGVLMHVQASSRLFRPLVRVLPAGRIQDMQRSSVTSAISLQSCWESGAVAPHVHIKVKEADLAVLFEIHTLAIAFHSEL